MTETKENYQSPYKPYSSVQEKMLNRMEKEQNLLAKTKDYFFTQKYNLSLNQASKFNCRALNGENSILSQHKYLKSINNNSQTIGKMR